MRAKCSNSDCHRTWELQKDPTDYKDGPRCPACGSREIDVEETDDGDEPVSAKAFRQFKQGVGPAELVEQGLCSPSKARELFREFKDLAGPDYRILTAQELRNKISNAREEEQSKADRKIRQIRRNATNQIENLRQERSSLQYEIQWLNTFAAEQYEDGWEDGVEHGYQQAVEEYDDFVRELAS